MSCVRGCSGRDLRRFRAESFFALIWNSVVFLREVDSMNIVINEEIAAEIARAIVAQATLRGLSINDYLRQLLGLGEGPVQGGRSPIRLPPREMKECCRLF